MWLELLNDYDIGVMCHPGKANIVVDALSKKPISSVCLLTQEKRLLKELEALYIKVVLLRDRGYLSALQMVSPLVGVYQKMLERRP